MTNQEAIETIKIAIAEVEWNYPMDYSIAFDMAIAALEKEKIYKSTIFKISETLVDESKLHITPEKACEQIREYLKQKDLKLSQLKEVKE